jgi:hypothetical protein
MESALERIAELERENAALKQRLSELEARRASERQAAREQLADMYRKLCDLEAGRPGTREEAASEDESEDIVLLPKGTAATSAALAASSVLEGHRSEATLVPGPHLPPAARGVPPLTCVDIHSSLGAFVVGWADGSCGGAFFEAASLPRPSRGTETLCGPVAALAIRGIDDSGTVVFAAASIGGDVGVFGLSRESVSLRRVWKTGGELPRALSWTSKGECVGVWSSGFLSLVNVEGGKMQLCAVPRVRGVAAERAAARQQTWGETVDVDPMVEVTSAWFGPLVIREDERSLRTVPVEDVAIVACARSPFLQFLRFTPTGVVEAQLSMSNDRLFPAASALPASFWGVEGADEGDEAGELPHFGFDVVDVAVGPPCRLEGGNLVAVSTSADVVFVLEAGLSQHLFRLAGHKTRDVRMTVPKIQFVTSEASPSLLVTSDAHEGGLALYGPLDTGAPAPGARPACSRPFLHSRRPLCFAPKAPLRQSEGATLMSAACGTLVVLSVA